MSLIAELKRRNVFRVAVAYMILGWVVMQVVDIVVPALFLPQWVPTFFLLAGFIGFPFALLFAWAFELTPSGLKRSNEVTEEDSIASETSRKLEHLVVGLLVVALGFVIWDNYLSAPATAVAPAVIGKSIAVLPFANMSSDTEQDYFADGLSEELLNLLAKIPELKVAGRTSSFKFKGQNEDLRIIGKALDVATVLEGSVRKSGTRLRITAQLVNVADGFHLWSETYDREMTDIFDMQDDIAASIMAALQVHLGGAAPTRGRPTGNMEAYEKFLTARALGLPNKDEQILLLKDAVALDPGFAEAWEQMSLIYWLQAGDIIGSKEGAALAFAAASRAVALDPTLSIAAAMKASSNLNDYKWAREVAALEIAMRDHPEHTLTALALSFDYVEAGYIGDAHSVMQRFARIEPLNSGVQLRLALTFMALGRDAEALAQMHRADDLGDTIAQFWMFHLHIRRDEIDQAATALNAYFANLDKDTRVTPERLRSFLDPVTGRQALLDALPALETNTTVTGDAYAYYLMFGYVDDLFTELKRLGAGDGAWTDADIPLFVLSINGDPAVIGDPRYVELLGTGSTDEMWDSRGAPDRCSKATGNWVCE